MTGVDALPELDPAAPGFADRRLAILNELRERAARDEDAGGAWIPFDEIPLPFAQVVADAQQERRIQHGQSVLIRGLEAQEGDWIKVLNQRHKFIAVGSVEERIGSGGVGVVQPKVVFT